MFHLFITDPVYPCCSERTLIVSGITFKQREKLCRKKQKRLVFTWDSEIAMEH